MRRIPFDPVVVVLSLGVGLAAEQAAHALPEGPQVFPRGASLPQEPRQGEDEPGGQEEAVEDVHSLLRGPQRPASPVVSITSDGVGASECPIRPKWQESCILNSRTGPPSARIARARPS